MYRSDRTPTLLYFTSLPFYYYILVVLEKKIVIYVHQNYRYEDGTFWPHLRESNYDFIGDGLGKGFNVNVPLNATGLGPREYLAILHQVSLAGNLFLDPSSR